MGDGWIKLHRAVLNHWTFSDPITFKAWMFILLTANHKPAKVLFDGELMPVGRGQFLTSVRKFAEQVGCTRRKAERLLLMFESDEMVTRTRCKRGTLLTVVNYGFYQDMRDSESTNESTNEGTNESTQTRRIKNDKEVKEEKKKIYYVDSVAEIFAYLNEKTGKNYTGRSKAQREHIVARLKEGYSVEEFKTVIDNKVRAWGDDPKMKQYLRPETLFSSKFETYLNDTEDKEQRERRLDDEIHRRQRAAIAEATGEFKFS